VSDPLPQLLDAKHLAAELGVTRAAAEAIMRKLPKVEIDGLRKVFVRRADVLRLSAVRAPRVGGWRFRFRSTSSVADGSRRATRHAGMCGRCAFHRA